MIYDLEALAKQLLKEKGLQPEFSKEALEQLQTIQPASLKVSKDLRSLPWCSIDNDDSRDLDQLTYAENGSNGQSTLWVAIADVDSLVTKDTPLDLHAQINTTSIYTPAKIFHMLPEKLSTDFTSLNEDADRLAIVAKININQAGAIEESSIFEAAVRNKAKLAYKSVGAWLEGKSELPERIKSVPGLENALKDQHEVAQKLKKRRHASGALTLDSPKLEARISASQQIVLKQQLRTAADELIEHFMIAANNVIANYLASQKIPSIRRVVRVPKNWDRIVEIAASLGDFLPEKPDSKALDAFLIHRKDTDVESFPDLSLSIIKLLGRGEYIVEMPGSAPTGHFGLALSEYTHSTAPNRRFPDLISQRQLKAAIANQRNPYSIEELKMLATHCTVQEDNVMKVERQLNKAAAAILLEPEIGKIFQGIITGADSKGTWVRLFDPPVEGKVLTGFERLQVGYRVSVQLISVDIPRGFINFSLV